jgi:hypothetical protein
MRFLDTGISQIIFDTEILRFEIDYIFNLALTWPVLYTCYNRKGTLQPAAYLMFVIYTSSSIAFAGDMALARGVIYDCKTFIEQATTEMVDYDRNIFIVQVTS